MGLDGEENRSLAHGQSCPQRRASRPYPVTVAWERPAGAAGAGGLARMTLDQTRARVFSVLYLVTFVTSIPAWCSDALAASHRDHPGVPVGALPRRLLHLQGVQAVVS